MKMQLDFGVVQKLGSVTLGPGLKANFAPRGKAC